MYFDSSELEQQYMKGEFDLKSKILLVSLRHNILYIFKDEIINFPYRIGRRN